jgi:transcriptional regulator GlxA family with amidase domain
MTASTVFIMYPEMKLLDLAGPLQVFSDALNVQGKAAYKTSIKC